MTPEEARERVAKQDRELAELQALLVEVASRNAGAVVMALLDAIIGQLAGHPEFVTPTRIRIYRAMLAQLTAKDIQ